MTSTDLWHATCSNSVNGMEMETAMEIVPGMTGITWQDCFAISYVYGNSIMINGMNRKSRDGIDGEHSKLFFVFAAAATNLIQASHNKCK